MNTPISDFLLSAGMSISSASKKTGIPYITISQHARGIRQISPRLAIQYEKLLGVPRQKLRPDIWEDPAPADSNIPENADAENG